MPFEGLVCWTHRGGLFFWTGKQWLGLTLLALSPCMSWGLEMPHPSLQSPGVSLKAACKIMLCLSQSVLQRMHSPVKHWALLFYTWCHIESAPGEQESSAVGHGVPRAAVVMMAPEAFMGEWAAGSQVLHSKCMLVDAFGFAKLVQRMVTL